MGQLVAQLHDGYMMAMMMMMNDFITLWSVLAGAATTHPPLRHPAMSLEPPVRLYCTIDIFVPNCINYTLVTDIFTLHVST